MAQPPESPARRCLLLGAASLSLLPARSLALAAPLQLLSYYDYPPFQVAPGQGLSQDLAQWLEREGLVRPQLEVLPRRRVDAITGKAGWQGLVPWVAPSWFPNKSAERPFVWSEPLMDDEDLVLSRRAHPIVFEGVESLRGLTLGGVFGHVYRDADPMVLRGELTRLDSFTQEANLRMLQLGRVDAIFLSRSGLGWWKRRLPEFDALFIVAARPRMRYQRHLMISAQLPTSLRAALLDAVVRLRASADWREMLERYEVHVAEPACCKPAPAVLAGIRP
ncbi:ABC transporter substrate-binding protein [Pelomonas sp. SE-A7]|uniref:substrate-binding periplasmic protein n=1 Tax=Pelomonas sp. SE-A7 TaxID=3054953 RepID=UPI00259CB1F2|nr:ABC transporter substrate-binding protein [Pelomonas sp. SE-A7]MDM4766209.1 ABC transporter substrate-binding protein [Pelomonas sp. SE-A7]